MSIGTFLITHMYEGRQRGARLLFTDSFFSMAGMIFPMVAAVLLARSIEWYWVYACIGLVYVAIFVLTFGCDFPVLGKKAQSENSQPVVKEKWGIGVLFLSVAALCYILGQLGFISWVPEYAKSLGMSLGDAGKLVSDFWMSYMIGMWSFSFILRFFDLQRILTVLAGLATVLMYLFINGSPEHMPWFILTLGFFSSAIYTSIITLGSQQTRVASPKLVNFILTCGTIGTMLTFVVTGPIVGGQRSLAALHTANGLYAVVFVMCFILGFVSVIARTTLRRRLRLSLRPLCIRKGLFLIKESSSPPRSVWIQLCAGWVVAITLPWRIDQRTGTWQRTASKPFSAGRMIRLAGLPLTMP